MPTVYTEGRHPGEGLLSELPGTQSREVVVIAAGSGIIAPGSVLGVYTSGDDDTKYSLSPNAAADPDVGNQVAVAIALYGCDATGVDQEITAIVRGAEWNGNTLTYDASVDNDAKKAAKATQLAAAGIIVR